MKISQKIGVLSQLGVIDWVEESENDEAIRVIINSLAHYYFDGESCNKFAPSSFIDAIPEHFLESGYDYDWYDILTNQFMEHLSEDNYADPVESISYDTSGYSCCELQDNIESWLRDWHEACLKQFKLALN